MTIIVIVIKLLKRRIIEVASVTDRKGLARWQLVYEIKSTFPPLIL